MYLLFNGCCLRNGYGDPGSNAGRDFSLSANTLAKGMNSVLLPPAIGKFLRSLNSLTLVWQPVLEKENTEY